MFLDSKPLECHKSIHSPQTRLKKNPMIYGSLRKATITRCDLSPQFFCVDATLLCEFESDNMNQRV